MQAAATIDLRIDERITVAPRRADDDVAVARQCRCRANQLRLCKGRT